MAISRTGLVTNMLYYAVILSVIASGSSGGPVVRPVLTKVSETARFSWEIPPGSLGPGTVYFTVNPAGIGVFILTSSGLLIPYESYGNRLGFQGNRTSRNVTFTMSNIQTSDAGTYTCGAGAVYNVIHNCGQKLVVLGKPTTPGRPVSTTPVYNQQVTLTCNSTSTSVPADHGLVLTYTWQRDNDSITVNTIGPTYTFTVSSRDSHNYRCRARESQGLESDWSQMYNMEPQYGPSVSAATNTLNPGAGIPVSRSVETTVDVQYGTSVSVAATNTLGPKVGTAVVTSSSVETTVDVQSRSPPSQTGFIAEVAGGVLFVVVVVVVVVVVLMKTRCECACALQSTGTTDMPNTSRIQDKRDQEPYYQDIGNTYDEIAERSRPYRLHQLGMYVDADGRDLTYDYIRN
ncbi:uncharacterized protein LOC124255658 isoform X2 [Haliotis rubra]|uniref:uncharacterized protein LOC124255658 isoform X2 n=1 Tax=Haliotis rubra TaxID=36100 RepID=UPI001EE5399B|nr:uncharacterized protein LOC124255658 isoform X2 [Haliotis rubra]